MRFRFNTTELQELYTDEKDAHKYPPAVVSKFFDIMAIVAAASDERVLYQMKSLHFEKLHGQLQGKHSMRLNRRYRLIVTFENDKVGRRMVVLEISKHYE